MSDDPPLSVPQCRHLLALLGGPVRGRTSLDARPVLAPSQRSGVVGVLERLTQRGLVELVPDSWNGSTFAYRLTADGERFARKELL